MSFTVDQSAKNREEKPKKQEGKMKEQRMDSEWHEGVVTSVFNGRMFITFKLGSTVSSNTGKNALSVGDVVDISVVYVSTLPSKDDHFKLVEIGKEIRKRKDLIVRPFETSKCNVYCDAEVIDTCDGYFLLDTPVIGKAFFPYKDSPREMEVGDVWKVRMIRRKEKQTFPSYWMATEIVGEHSRLSTTEDRRIERKEETKSISSGYSSANSHPSSPNLDEEWNTVIINGESKKFWFGNCAIKDGIRICKQLNESGVDLERGLFYRVKWTGDLNGTIEATDLDPTPLHLNNFQLEKHCNYVKVWCYSTIMDRKESVFITWNELLGNATITLSIADSEMKVGDKVETLYRKVRANVNEPCWIVQEVRFALPSRVTEDIDREEIQKEEDAKQKHTGVVKSSAKVNMDRHVLDKMHLFFKFPEVRKALAKDPKNIEMIKRILRKDIGM